ncbi:MAG: glycosyltransferase [Microgenomates group bacterium]
MKKQNNSNVCIIIDSLIAGGAERNIINLTRHLKKNNGIRIDVVLIKNIIDYEKEYQSLKAINIINLSSNKKEVPKYLKPVVMLMRFIKLVLLSRQNKYDIFVGAIEFYPFYFATFAALILNKKSILMIGNNILEELKLRDFLHSLLMKMSFVMTNKVVCISMGIEKISKNIYGIPNNKITTIYSGLDIEHIKRNMKSKTPDLNINQGSFYISILGRLEQKKGHIYLIEAMKIVCEVHPEATLLIIGKGSEYSFLKNEVKKNKLMNNVRFLGFVSNPYPYLSQSDLFVFSSLFEGFGNVIVEAMACGLPIISTDCISGPKEIICSSGQYERLKNLEINKIIYCKNGLLVPPKNSSLLARAIIKVIENKKLLIRYQEANLTRAIDFSVKIMVDKYMDLFTTI